ncbi:3-oxoacyl-[acyl-carrier-protein] synthase III [Bradyrhizobium liaoningense]
MSFITGVGLTPFGKHEGSSSLGLMSQAAQAALDDAGLTRSDIDGILCGYSTVSPHIMLATVFAEHFGIPRGSVKIPRVWSLETPPPDDRRQRR